MKRAGLTQPALRLWRGRGLQSKSCSRPARQVPDSPRASHWQSASCRRSARCADSRAPAKEGAPVSHARGGRHQCARLVARMALRVSTTNFCAILPAPSARLLTSQCLLLRMRARLLPGSRSPAGAQAGMTLRRRGRHGAASALAPNLRWEDQLSP